MAGYLEKTCERLEREGVGIGLACLRAVGGGRALTSMENWIFCPTLLST